MARPRKQGLDYFSMDITFDEKVEFIEEIHGADGFYLWVKLLQRIYANGYFLEWTKILKVLLKKETKIEIDRIYEIVNDCCEVGLFDKRLFNGQNILTSRGIQKRFFEVAKRREQVDIVAEYILFDELLKRFCVVSATEISHELSESGSFSTESEEEIIRKQDETDDLGSNSVTSIPTRTRGKESKVKNSKAKNSKEDINRLPKIKYAEFVKLTEEEHGKLLSELEEFGTQWVIDKLNNYKGANGKKYRSDYMAIRNWVINEYRKKHPVIGGELHAGIESDLRERDFNNF